MGSRLSSQDELSGAVSQAVTLAGRLYPTNAGTGKYRSTKKSPYPTKDTLGADDCGGNTLVGIFCENVCLYLWAMAHFVQHTLEDSSTWWTELPLCWQPIAPNVDVITPVTKTRELRTAPYICIPCLAGALLWRVS